MHCLQTWLQGMGNSSQASSRTSASFGAAGGGCHRPTWLWVPRTHPWVLSACTGRDWSREQKGTGYPGCQTAGLGSWPCPMALFGREAACSPTGESATSTVSCDPTSSPCARGTPSPPLCQRHETGDELFCRMHVTVPGRKPQPAARRAPSRTEEGMQHAGKVAEGAVLPMAVSSGGQQQSRPQASAAEALGAPLAFASLPGAGSCAWCSTLCKGSLS